MIIGLGLVSQRRRNGTPSHQGSCLVPKLSGTKARWCPGLTDQEGKAGQCEKPSLGPKGAHGGTKVGVENGSSGVELSVEFESRALDLIWSGPTW
ncbi:hypothetical protein PROFUN_12137 [Planoprotostelium fungivorum]|uniref:Uncharacterized protein n=1 Tax=Planoprotostelium fungivorum TaxID=1890364 RepID=A0A2P6N8A2_9EUKA|nr:hypothetical protein PROFUN_12137 [Planoprotostelium fungivorum]